MNKKGISLIVLIITIVIMIILAGAIILTLSNSGIIGKTNMAVFKNDVSNYKSELSIYISNQILEDEDFKINTFSSDCKFIKYYITTMSIKDTDRFIILQGNLVYISEGELFNIEELKALKDMGVKATTPVYAENLGVFDNTTDYTGQKIYINPSPKYTETEFDYFFNPNSNQENSFSRHSANEHPTAFAYYISGQVKFYEYMYAGSKIPNMEGFFINGKAGAEYESVNIRYNVWLELTETEVDGAWHLDITAILPENLPSTIIEGTIQGSAFNASELGKYASFNPYLVTP